jgi:hypothetical protein
LTFPTVYEVKPISRDPRNSREITLYFPGSRGISRKIGKPKEDAIRHFAKYFISRPFPVGGKGQPKMEMNGNDIRKNLLLSAF